MDEGGDRVDMVDAIWNHQHRAYVASFESLSLLLWVSRIAPGIGLVDEWYGPPFLLEESSNTFSWEPGEHIAWCSSNTID